LTTTSDLLDMPLATLLVAFFNLRERASNEFEIVSSYKQSKFVNLPLDLPGTAKNLGTKYGLPFIVQSDSTILATLTKTRPVTLAGFRKELFAKIIEILGAQEKSNAMNREIALALIGLRGSADHSSLYAVDAQSGTTDHIKDVLDLLTRHASLGNQVNFNPRAAQPGFVAGTKRDDQVRIKLAWVRANLREEIGAINHYKLATLDATDPSN
jgi:hypothetical protein